MRTPKRHTVHPLVALNAILLIALALVSFSSSADAQRARYRGDYTMVTGRVQGVVSDVVYIVDSHNQHIAAFQWNQAQKLYTPIGYSDIGTDLEASRGGGR
ncbi:MAG: hypothetical protein ACYTF7_07770 [Planctomycetota bacterium]|jgi:hypothetical protein